MASGLAIGVTGEAGIKGIRHNDILIAIILLMIFAEAIALYGFIVAIVLISAWTSHLVFSFDTEASDNNHYKDKECKKRENQTH